jgi:hypothetical protein
MLDAFKTNGSSPPLAVYRSTCAWCGALEREFLAPGEGGETHGICEPCAARVLASLPRK